jgi:hypothetical protein
MLQSGPARQSGSAPETNSFYPSRVFSLNPWKLTLPVASSSDPSILSDILQPELASFEMPPWFAATSDKKGVIFRAPVNAPTTANSSYPRAELREMTGDGSEEEFWSSVSGTHTLLLDQAITATPKNKPDVVAGQIHGDDDDLVVIRLEGQKLFVARSKQDLATLDENYTLGKRFTVKFVAENGKIMVYYNGGGDPIYTLAKKVNKASPDLCSVDNYGEVVIYKAVITHQG